METTDVEWPAVTGEAGGSQAPDWRPVSRYPGAWVVNLDVRVPATLRAAQESYVQPGQAGPMARPRTSRSRDAAPLSYAFLIW
jgi:hypothetical protein